MLDRIRNAGVVRCGTVRCGAVRSVSKARSGRRINYSRLTAVSLVNALSIKKILLSLLKSVLFVPDDVESFFG
jgi:hypothetical protein